MLFTKHIHKLLSTNYSNPEFNYPKLCEELNLSRSQVYRKFQENDMGSASDYIRRFRLKKALGLLQSSDWSITDIAFKVGFKDSNHFTDRFTAEFSQKPGEIRKIDKNNLT